MVKSHNSMALPGDVVTKLKLPASAGTRESIMKLFYAIICPNLSSVAVAKVEVSDMKLSGGLCSNNDTVISVSDDNETFTAIFNNFYLEADDSVEKGHCRLSWKLNELKVIRS